jgi:hypothetical protein
MFAHLFCLSQPVLFAPLYDDGFVRSYLSKNYDIRNKKSIRRKFVEVGTIYRYFTVITLNYSSACNDNFMKFLTWKAIWSWNTLSTSMLL